ncbi:response regulator [Methylobacterium sp. Leaf118]|uniref:response regulator n=1 Tax=Methylobacterium sp. Leaf118 TaxID=2876562 RepID=UPI001E4BDBF8|nr:response regulator [Methylobacterium sp. Leaf118]
MTDGVRSRSLVASFALFALALVVPLTTVALVATHWYVTSERERLRTVVTLIGEDIRERVGHDLSEMAAIARTLAASPSIDAGDTRAFRAQALASIDTVRMSVTLTELDGRQRVNTRARTDEALPRMPRPELLARVAEAGRPVVSDVIVSALTGRRIVAVAAPVLRGGAVVQVVAVVMQVDQFERLLRTPHLGPSYWAAIVDGEGQRVAQVGLDAGTEEPDEPESGKAEPAASVAHLSGASDVLHISEDSKGSGWRFVAGAGRDALEAPLRNSLFLLLALAAILVGCGGWLAQRMARGVARTAARLAAKAEAIGRGEIVAAEESHVREVGIIGRALARASRTLAEQRAALDAARAALRARADASQSRYRMLAQNVSDIIVLYGPDGPDFSCASLSIERTLGYDDAARATLTDATYLHPDDQAVIDEMRAALAAGEPHAPGLFRARHRDGRWVWLECVCNLIEAAAPGEPYAIAVMRDVTARKQQADELRIACDMAELAKAKAENASRAKSEFLAMMSHEIRTPLATIRGYTDLLGSSGPLSAEQARCLALVSDATGTMLTAVDDILDFARIEAGDFHLQDKPFALARAVESVTAFVRPIAAERGITLGLTIDPNLPATVRGDPRRLRQILLNLLNAALRDRRGGLVTLSLYALHGAENRISFALTGSGGHALPTERDGLGLAIARRLVSRMGGRLESVSFTGEAASSRFSLQLPAARALPEPGAGESGATETPAAPPPAPRDGLAGVTILLAEDHAINQELTRRLLERQGCEVDVVADGAAAVAAVQARIYDLVLMDVQMPGMDGLTATRRIRALPHPSRHVPIVALTAGVLPEQVRAILEAGLNAHLAKPIDRAELCAAIAGQLSAVVLAETEAAAPAAPLIDRRPYQGLVAALGPDSARGALRGFVALLDATFADAATLRAEAGTLAAGARRFGLLELGAALDHLAEAEDGAALRRCHAARDLVGRSLDELVGVEPIEVSARVAHL